MNQSFLRTYIDAILWTIAVIWTVLAIGIAWYNFTHEINIINWVTFYKWFILILFSWSIPVTLLFIIGGIRDLKRLFSGLNDEAVDNLDNGQVHSNGSDAQ